MLPEVTHMAYARVAADAVPGYPRLRAIDQGVSDFLGDHIDELRKITDKHKIPPGRFIDRETKVLFRNLYFGSDEEFLAAADALTKRLIGRMDGRTAQGLLICLRAASHPDRFAGVLKLQVVAEHAAVLEALDSGEERLSAVSKLLDKPGDLQKGALTASWLPEDRVMVGDRLSQEASYFPDAFGIKIFSRPTAAVGDLLTALSDRSPDIVWRAAAALPHVAPGEPRTVLAELGQRIPELTEAVQADVAEALENRPKPVGYIDTSHPSTESIKVGNITISGPVAEMRRRVRVEQAGERQSHDEQWQVIIDADHWPHRTHRS
jgi:hypothetical protein